MISGDKMRVDVYLFDNGYADSRSKARALIDAGAVVIDGETVKKASLDIDGEREHSVEILVREKYVSRGGLKLEAALDACEIDVKNMHAIDIGASTGGFTDCLLSRGAAKVFAIDSGTLQLHPKLCADERVVSIEKYNARNLRYEDIGEKLDIAVMDVSFISQTCIIGALAGVLNEGAYFISLIKPQFEAGRSAIGKGGIVKDKKDRFFAVKRVLDFAKEQNFVCEWIGRSPILGGDGNAEYLAVFKYKIGINGEITDNDIRKITEC